MEGCERQAERREWCMPHYRRVRRTPGGPIPVPDCSVEGCERPRVSRGWCGMHYLRWRRWGDPLRESLTPIERVMAKVAKGPGCWEWQGFRNELGYGIAFVGKKRRRAHRVVYELLVGPIPDGLVLDHLYRNTPCVNPAHLEPVTQRENIRRAVWVVRKERAAARTHCNRGHELTPENTYIVAKTGRRKCRKCAADAHQRRKAQR